MTDADELQRKSIHESAHAWAGLRFGYPPTVVSIRPGASHGGVTLFERSADQHLSKLIDGRHPLDGLDPAARRFADQRMVSVVIGDEAAALLGPPVTGRIPDRPETLPRRKSAEVVPADGAGLPRRPLSPERRDLLDASDATDSLDDVELAWEMAYKLVGELANPYLVWIRAEARRLARDNARPIHALAAALRASEVLDGADAVAILEAQEKPE
jgi:hypothetical protein